MNDRLLAAYCAGRLFELRAMGDIWDRSWEFLLLRRFAGGPGLPENSLFHFGLPAIVHLQGLESAFNRART